MRTYTVQARFNHGGRLVGLGQFKAYSSLGAILQAGKTLSANGETCVELVATEEG